MVVLFSFYVVGSVVVGGIIFGDVVGGIGIDLFYDFIGV